MPSIKAEREVFIRLAINVVGAVQDILDDFIGLTGATRRVRNGSQQRLDVFRQHEHIGARLGFFAARAHDQILLVDADVDWMPARPAGVRSESDEVLMAKLVDDLMTCTADQRSGMSATAMPNC